MVHYRSAEAAKVAFFGALFAACTDIYATRWDNPHAGKHGWIPAVRGGWRKGVRHEDRGYLPLTARVLESHLRGDVHVGLYSLLDGDRCWWLAADFDKEEALFQALMYIKAGRALQVPVALEVSRSGVGAQAWKGAHPGGTIGRENTDQLGYTAPGPTARSRRPRMPAWRS